MTLAAGPIFFKPWQTTVDNTGVPVPGALMNFYVEGTSTRATTYSDPGLTTPHTNPVVADSAGVYPVIYLSPTVSYKVIETDADGNLIESADPANFVRPDLLVAWQWVGGSPLSSQILFAYVFAVNATFPADYDGAYGWVRPSALPASNYTITLTNQDGDAAGTIVIDTAGDFTFTTPGSAPISFDAGEVLIGTGGTAPAMTDFSGAFVATIGAS